jgi:hypothetical protein
MPNNGQVNTSNVLQVASRYTCPNLRSSSWRGLLPVSREANKELHVEDVNEVNDDFVFDDNGFPNDDKDNQDVSYTEEKDGPDLSILDLYLKLFKLRANPLGLARFSWDEKVQIELCSSLGIWNVI